MTWQDHDGFLDAEDLRKSLGESADVMQLIKAADKNGDGKVGGTLQTQTASLPLCRPLVNCTMWLMLAPYLLSTSLGLPHADRLLGVL